jgi:hypothetical protein
MQDAFVQGHPSLGASVAPVGRGHKP